ncbi:N-6 DNA methylase [Dehalococcoidales bacterium]|nr:N-6 DNA methylase [Dehalococcoidales bacterium]
MFSDYYLEELVGEDSHWQALKKNAWEYRQRIANILGKAVPGINGDTPEAEVERRLIHPVLDTLGHVYFVQPAVPSSEGVRRPDYAFFPSAGALREAESYKGQLEFFKTALAVADAKAWERSLDKRVKGPGDPFTNHNPSYQIDFYLRATDKRWGLLTNGRHWRLYHRDLSYRLDVYYEVDLPQIVTLDEDAFLYFLAFFCKEAFQPDGTGECFLDRAYRRSTEYAAGLSDELEDNVYEALRLLAEGFLSFPGNNLQPQDLDLVRENAFIVIYRLLFTLYAEAREFLPVTNPTYEDTYSLRALANEIATKEPFESRLSSVTTGYWTRLKDLFTLINTGDDFLHIPPYNGRLFDDQKEHKSLATWQIGDRYLAAAIDQLARARAAGRTGRGFVSYRDLSIRELGSIYEGLLEHRPRYAAQAVAVIREDKREKFIPLTELGNRKALKTYLPGSVYLETDKGERKATGSYYTPDYIVKYIVSNTLGPLLEEAKKSDGNLIDAILSLKVLDPAMGSGHFLVEATDFLTRALVEALGGDPREMEEDEIRWARREVVERCIYGVDLNPLAVDLAKLSLWLSTVSLDKPLNFLDHHLRCGNSLIGAKLEDLGQLPVLGRKKGTKAAPASQSLVEYYFHQNVATAVDNYFRISQIPSDKPQDIQEKEKLYGIARDILKRYRDVAHIWTSVYFGNEVPAEGYMMLQDKIRATEPEWAELEKKPWFAEAVEMGEEERRFFHWELEFPEVFFDRNGQRLQNPGFSAVVGNPPYVQSKFLPQVDKAYYSLAFTSMKGQYDIFNGFVERACQILQPGGQHSLIVPTRFWTNPDYEAFRRFILPRFHIRQLVDVGERIFEEVEMPTSIFVFQRDGLTEERELPVLVRVEVTDLSGGLWSEHATNQQEFATHPAAAFTVYQKPELKRILENIRNVSEQFSVYVDNARGVEIGKRSDIVAMQPGKGKWVPFVIGEHIDRYEIREYWYVRLGVPDVDYKDPSLYEGPKIMVRKTGTGIRAVSDSSGLYTIQVVYIFKPKTSQIDINYLVCLLNSNLMWRYYFSEFGEETKQAFPHLRQEVVLGLPIRRINFTTPQLERERLVEDGKKLYQEYLKSRDWSRIMTFVAQRLPQKPDGTPDTEHEQSDVVHDLLAFLAEEMTQLHKGKQIEIKGFLHWLEAYLGISVQSLKNKTKVKEYWKAEVGWEGFVTALEQNRKAIVSAKGIDVTRREPRETIRSEFDASVAKLGPLLDRIHLTDKLIDQIVYKLYGLTKEEIAVVEGRG